MYKTIAVAALLCATTAKVALAQLPDCPAIASGGIAAVGITVNNPEPLPVCRDINPGGLLGAQVPVCTMATGAITSTGVTIVQPVAPAACTISVGGIIAEGVNVQEPDGGSGIGGGGIGEGMSCPAGTEFTIRVPVNTRGNTVQYRWYRDGLPLTGTGAQGTLSANGTEIIYTIHEDDAHGDDRVIFHFMYTLNDGCDAWTSSEEYPLVFWTGSNYCRAIDPGTLAGTLVPVCTLNVGGITAVGITIVQPSTPSSCTLNEGRITAQGIVVIEPTAARAGIFGFFGRLFN